MEEEEGVEEEDKNRLPRTSALATAADVLVAVDAVVVIVVVVIVVVVCLNF
jgi:CHASE3 domain sensor protein